MPAGPRMSLIEVDNDPAKRLTVAEDDELAGILDHWKAAPSHLLKEWFSADETLDIAHLPPDHAAFPGRLRCEQMGDPVVSRKVGG
jgi:hypothetical protein